MIFCILTCSVSIFSLVLCMLLSLSFEEGDEVCNYGFIFLLLSFTAYRSPTWNFSFLCLRMYYSSPVIWNFSICYPSWSSLLITFKHCYSEEVARDWGERTRLQFSRHMRTVVFLTLFQLSYNSSLNLFQLLEAWEYIPSSYFCFVIYPSRPGGTLVLFCL